MTDTSTTEGAPASSHSKPSPTWKSPRSIAIAALVIAVIATAVAIAAWLHPGVSRSFSDKQSAQAKTIVCSAWAPIRKSVWNGTPNPRPDDPVAQLSVAANVRLAMLGGGSYLKETLAAEPATPPDLAKAVASVANTLQLMGVNYLAMTASPAVIDPLHHDLDTEGVEIGRLCK
ncbi:hypothetical protein [Mycobacterium sp.]|uniref:hypothetical protein n=1 Tax=Mycobacterium sp. TaxID=1785 RepID=UPI0031DC608B